MTKRDTVPLDELELKPVEERKPKPDVPAWLWTYMVKKKGQDEDLVRSIWKELQKSGFENPRLTVIRLKTSLFPSLVGVYSSAGGAPGPDANYLVEAFQLASAEEDAS